MTDNNTSTVLTGPPSMGEAATGEPTFCNARVLANGVCEAAEKVIETDRKLRASLKTLDDPAGIHWIVREMNTKENIIAELTDRILKWNKTKCPKCHASLKGTGPQVLNESEVKYYQDQYNQGHDKSESAARTKISEAETRLREMLAKSQKGGFLGFL